jgi:hypothetical protein
VVETSTFRSYLRILVELDSSLTLKPRFNLTQPDGAITVVSFKYEMLDVYYFDCGLIGHKQIFCLAPQVARFPTKYKTSLKVTIFSNLLPQIPTNHPSENHPLTVASQDNFHGLESPQIQLSSITPYAEKLGFPPKPNTSLSCHYTKPSLLPPAQAQTSSQTVLHSQHVSNPIPPTATTIPHDNPHQIPLNTLSLTHQPTPSSPNCLLDSYQNSN